MTARARAAMRRLGMVHCYACRDLTARKPVRVTRVSVIGLLRRFRSKVRKRAAMEKSEEFAVEVRLCDRCCEALSV